MHDPMVVAHEIPSPIPHREKWRDRSLAKPTGWTRSRRTNEENRGEPTYPWWRPKGWTLGIGGRAYGLNPMVTIWHVEPNGADSGTVCKHWRKKPDGASVVDRSWRWHVHHWHLQIHLLQAVHRRLFERCIECGRPYPWRYAPISHAWSDEAGPWWKVTRRAYHHECSSLVGLRASNEQKVEAIRQLVAMARVLVDESEDEFVQRFWGATWSGTAEFAVRRGVWVALGYEYDDRAGRLVRLRQEQLPDEG